MTRCGNRPNIPVMKDNRSSQPAGAPAPGKTNGDIPELCRECTARHNGICGALTVAELIEFNRLSVQREFDAGQTLMADAEDFPFFATVLNGVVKLSKTLADGRQQIVGLQFAPDFLGRPFHRQSNLSVEAASDVKLCTMARSCFETMMEKMPGLQQRLFRQVLLELDESRQWLVTLGRKTARERVASFLYMIARHASHKTGMDLDQANEVSFDLPLTRTDMADFLGLTIETVSRQLTKLKREGLISIFHNRHITVPDLEKLKQAGEEE